MTYVHHHVITLHCRSAVQSLMKMSQAALRYNYHPDGLTHTWATYYQVRLSSSQACINEWYALHADNATSTCDFCKYLSCCAANMYSAPIGSYAIDMKPHA